MRDIWRRVVTGKLDQEGKPEGETGRLLTVLGSEKVIDHELCKYGGSHTYVYANHQP